jgi:hypothetical protein
VMVRINVTRFEVRLEPSYGGEQADCKKG